VAFPPADSSPGSGHWDTPEAAANWRRMEAYRTETLAAATELMLALAQLTPGSHVLDVAAGTGDQTVLAAHRVGPLGSVLAIDAAASMVDAAATAGQTAGLSNITTRVMDAQALSLADEAFDAVICRNGLHAEMRRVLKPGGRLAVVVFAALDQNPLFAIPDRIVRNATGQPAAASGAPGMFGLGDPAVLTSLCEQVGFREVAVHRVAAPRRFVSPAAAVDFLQHGRNAVVAGLADFEPKRRELTWTDIEIAFRPFETPDGVLIPGESLVGVATR
jgi:protein-L-isoaspartate O-methyltransferase